MASNKKQEDCPERKEELVDTAIVNQLIHSVGRLKFSLSSLESMNLKIALLPEEVQLSESDLLGNIPTQESNQVLEKAFEEFLSQKVNKEADTTELKASKDVSQNDSNIDQLQYVFEQLQGELHKIRKSYQKSFSEKTRKSIEV